MKAAIVRAAGQTPVFADFEEPQPQPGQVLVKVTASAISRLTRARASGQHYSFNGQYPFVAGVDGVGVLADGRRVFFAFPAAPFGAMAERVAIDLSGCVPVPEGVDDVTAAALGNPGMSGWMALRERAGFRRGEVVLINGATGSSGRMAVQIARYLGAGRIIVTGRNPAMLEQLQTLGADEAISLTQDEKELRERFNAVFAAGVDVVLDYLWGKTAGLLLASSAMMTDAARPLRFVNIGSMSGEEIQLPAALLRSRATALMGSGLGSVSSERLMAALGEVLASAPDGRYQIGTQTAPLADVARAWARDTGNQRLVLQI
ncbi:alcohol dehydrogenase [Camelimonas fluminis]|uniref:Zinc-binding alcohol dehydrogenase family protein n=1 Tax=Camelimonas fluminis TaxID=1576911 RepID=A0ABV7UJK7_9HYPH|nr:zinc-binding alcohol dehydrogenase family protein [Camelimonas fluminis]GHE68543.1 alcohol dehydrogenase [Camelimonas fluminis]